MQGDNNFFKSNKSNQEERPSVEVLPSTEHNALFTQFWKELHEGKGVEKGQEMVEQLLKEYTSVEALTQLTDIEYKNLIGHLNYYFAREVEAYNKFYKTLIDDDLILVDEDSLLDFSKFIHKSDGQSLVNVSSLNRSNVDEFKMIVEILSKKGFKILTKEQKIELCSKPEFLYKVSHYFSDEKNNQYLRPQNWVSGSRNLIGKLEGYYDSKEDYLKQLKEVRQLTGKSNLKILDVGSNFGFALRDMKMIDNNVETFNMTIDETPSIYGDHIVHYPAELMPKEFYESMDIIESQVAFRYFPYSDIGLQNIIKALSVGGTARIHYTPGHVNHISLNENKDVDISREEIKQRDTNLRELLKTLVKENYIKLEGSDNNFIQSLYPDSNNHYLLDGFVKITKNKSISSFDFKPFR